MHPAPSLTVIVPVYNGSHFLDRCLSGLRASDYPNFELIVADDASTDNSGEVARRHGARVLRMPRQSGPGAARNAAAREASGEVVFFVDADVVVAPDAVRRVAENFRAHPNVAAVFGSYDDSPAENNFLSQYKNLCHHFVHQQGNTEASTFWGGCGAVADVGAQPRDELPAFEVFALKLLVEPDAVARGAQPVAELNVFNRGPGETLGVEAADGQEDV
jgi:glycosyltransferase involved in cell wall biosynthesis